MNTKISATARMYYISPTGSDSTGNGSSASPWASFNKAFNTMSGGDVLIAKNGTYNKQILFTTQNGGSGYNPPSGSASGYTIIKAETNGGVVVDGQGEMSPIDGGACGVKNAYMVIEGIVFRHQAHGALVGCADHVKFIRDGFEDAGDGNSMNFWIVTSSSSYVLVEECFAWGSGRYKFGGGTNSIFRRNVARMDIVNAGGEPVAGYGLYSVTNVEVQNSISIDGDHPEFWRDPLEYGGAYYVPSTSAPTVNTVVKGSIALNMGMSFGNITKDMDNVSFVNNVGWHLREGVLLRDPVAYDHNTFGDIYGPALQTKRVGFDFWGGGYDAGAPSMTNSLLYKINSGNAVALNAFGQEDYNAFYGNDVNLAGTSAGAHSVALTADPGLRYITRIESNNASLHGKASDGGDIGANILYKIGVAGSLYGEPGYNTVTTESLWPFPYEDVIHRYMNAYTYTGPKTDGTTGTLSGNRGFAADGQTLTKYIWEYLGNPSPY